MQLRVEHCPESERDELESFVQGQIDRLAVSYHKYGAMAEGFPDRVDAIGSLMICLREYAKTGNKEFLIDAANFAYIEFRRPRHPQAHFRSTDDSESPGRLALKTGRADKRTNAQLE